jgi:hypothetical protein
MKKVQVRRDLARIGQGSFLVDEGKASVFVL